MFTGIIEATAEVASLSRGRLVLTRPESFDDVKIGSSIAVSGVCLSVIAFDGHTLSFDMVQTTLDKTTHGDLTAGTRVNLERALKADGRFEGHVVQGHCEGTGEVKSFARGMLTILLPQELLPFVVLHGSVTIDGVSLTVAALEGKEMTVALIPLTLKETTLGADRVGSRVNLETDILGRYVLSSSHHAG